MQSQRTRLRRRIATYRSMHWTEMLTSDFKAIFRPMQKKLGLKEYDIDEIINKASDEQIQEMHYKLDEFQLSNKHGW